MKHIESWDVEPGAVVKSLLKPTAAVPTTFWEVLMRSLHDGDAAGVWFCLSSPVWRAALPASVALAVLHLARWVAGSWARRAVLIACPPASPLPVSAPWLNLCIPACAAGAKGSALGRLLRTLDSSRGWVRSFGR